MSAWALAAKVASGTRAAAICRTRLGRFGMVGMAGTFLTCRTVGRPATTICYNANGRAPQRAQSERCGAGVAGEPRVWRLGLTGRFFWRQVSGIGLHVLIAWGRYSCGFYSPRLRLPVLVRSKPPLRGGAIREVSAVGKLATEIENPCRWPLELRPRVAAPRHACPGAIWSSPRIVADD